MPSVNQIINLINLMIWFFLQLESLESLFKDQKYPDAYRREEISLQLAMKEEVVRVGNTGQ